MSKFRPGESGNPRGRPKGRKTTTTALRERLAERADDVVQTVLDAALAGDLAAAKLVLERLVAPLRAQAPAVNVALPTGGLADQGRAILAAVADGRLPADSGCHLLTALGQVGRLVEIDELEARIRALEARHATS